MRLGPQISPLRPVFRERKRTGSVEVGNSWPIPPSTPPTACFTYVILDTDGTVGFDASCSTASGGTIVGWSWNFGDSTTSTTGPTVSHTYAATGSYDVELVVTDDLGAPSTVYHQTINVVVVPGLAHWWDTSVPSSITHSGGTASQIDDLVGGQHMSGGSQIPNYPGRTLAGVDVLDFVKNALPDSLRVGSTGTINIGSNSILLVAVVDKDTQASGTQMVLGKQTQAANTTGQYGLRFGSGDSDIQAILRDGNTDRTVSGTPAQVLGPQIIVQVINRESGSVTGRQNILRQNGVTLGTVTWSSGGTTGSLTTTNSSFGIGYTNGATGQFDGGWAEGRVYARSTDFTPAEVAAIESVLMSKWGL